MKRALWTIALAGCATQNDPDVYVVLPAVTQACATLDAAHLSIDVTTVQGEHFTVASDACQSRIANQDIPGWQLAFDRLADGYHRLTARIEAPDGTLIGKIEEPFTPKAPVVVGFTRGDLPGWPVATVTLTATACTADPGAMLHVVATPTKEMHPVADAMVPCSAPTLSLPRGDTQLAVEIHASDGYCTLATAEAFVFDDAPVPLMPGGSCP